MTTIPVIDADGHVTESTEQVAKYLDEPFRRRPLTAPFYPSDGWDRRLLGTLGDLGGDADAWLRALDRGGVETTVLYPTLGLFMSFLKDKEWAVALCRAYNTFLHEAFVTASPRLKAVALLPVQDPAACVVELRRSVRELGLVGAMLSADGSHLLGDASFMPLYEEAERLGVMVGVHASGSHLGGAGVDLFPRFIQAHTCSHAFGQMRQITSMMALFAFPISGAWVTETFSLPSCSPRTAFRRAPGWALTGSTTPSGWSSNTRARQFR